MGKYSLLKIEDRKKIYQLKQEGKGVSEIARQMGKNKSVISREISRNADDIGYLPDTAQKNSDQRRSHRKKRINTSEELKNYIVDKLQEHWSPEQIAGRMRFENKLFYASTETIYQFIYSTLGKSLGLYYFLRYKRAKRGQIYGRKHQSEIIKNRISIHERPTEIDDRSSVGDFEGDLTFFHGNRSANLTVIVDRMSRYTMLIKNESKNSLEIIRKIKNRLQDIICKSITFDNGSEFSKHTELNDELGIDTYFCDPGSPWQKGTVENSISRIHRFIPKNGDLSQWSDLEIGLIETKLNNTPRKKLGFFTPFEVFKSLNQGVAFQS